MTTDFIYEFVTPSDPVTFYAADDKIACVAGVILSSMAMIEKYSRTGIKVEYAGPTLAFNPHASEDLDSFLGEKFESFADNNMLALADCFDSFSYGNISDRLQYDDAIAAITDANKLEEFKSKHEDRERISMSQIVKVAWRHGKALREVALASPLQR